MKKGDVVVCVSNRYSLKYINELVITVGQTYKILSVFELTGVNNEVYLTSIKVTNNMGEVDSFLDTAFIPVSQYRKQRIDNLID